MVFYVISSVGTLVVIRDFFKMTDLGSNPGYCFYYLFILLLQDCSVVVSYISCNLFIHLFYSNIQFPLLDIIYILFYFIFIYLDYLQQGKSTGLQCHPIIQFFLIIISNFHFIGYFLHYRILPINFIIGYYPLSISLQISSSYVHPLHPSFSHSIHIHHLLITSTIIFLFYL